MAKGIETETKVADSQSPVALKEATPEQEWTFCPFCNGSGPGDSGVEGCTYCGGTNRVPMRG